METQSAEDGEVEPCAEQEQQVALPDSETREGETGEDVATARDAHTSIGMESREESRACEGVLQGPEGEPGEADKVEAGDGEAAPTTMSGGVSEDGRDANGDGGLKAAQTPLGPAEGDDAADGDTSRSSDHRSSLSLSLSVPFVFGYAFMTRKR